MFSSYGWVKEVHDLIWVIFVAESDNYILTYYALSSNTLTTKGYYSVNSCVEIRVSDQFILMLLQLLNKGTPCEKLKGFNIAPQSAPSKK